MNKFIFNKEQVDFIVKIGLKYDFEKGINDDNLLEMIEILDDYLVMHGLTENQNNVNEIGRICEEIIDIITYEDDNKRKKMKHYFIGSCECQQGMLEIVREKKTNALFVTCDECFSEWDTPDGALEKIEDDRNSHDTPCQPALLTEIKAADWEKYITETSDEDYRDYEDNFDDYN